MDLTSNGNDILDTLERERQQLEQAKKEILSTDSINPSYYGAGNGIECIDTMIQQYGEEEVKSFCKCNAFKYLFRCGHKNDPLEEMKKVQWYINKWIELQERKKK